MAGKKSSKSKAGCFLKLIIFIVIALIAIYVAARLLFPAERVKAEIIKRASQTLGRQVELDEVALSLFPGPSLDLRGLRVFNPENFPGGTLVSIDRLKLGLKLLPLLSKRFEFSEISVDHPVLMLRKTVDGRTNYTFQLKAGDKPIETPMGLKDSISSQEAAMTVFAFDWAEIKNGDIVYEDDSAQSKTVLSNFSLQTRLSIEGDRRTGRSTGALKIPTLTSTYVPKGIPLAVNLAYNADIDFQNADLALKNTTLDINGIVFNIDATVRNLMNPSSIFAAIKASDVPLEPLLEYLPTSARFDRSLLRLQGRLTGQAESRMEFGGNRTPYFSGSFTFKDLTLGYQTVTARLHFDALQVDVKPDTVSFTSQGGTLSEKEFSLAGRIVNWKDPVFDIKTKGSYELVGLVPFLKPGMNHELSGTTRFDLEVQGQKSQLVNAQLLGNLAVDRAYYKNDSLTAPLKRLDMAMTFGERIVTIDSLYAEYPGIRASVTGTIKNGFAHLIEPRKGHTKPYLDFVLRSPHLNYDTLVPSEDVPLPPAGTMPAPIFIPDIEAGGKVYVDTLIYSKMEFTNLSGDVSYDAGVITFKNAQGKLYSGNVSGDGSVDITDFYQPLVNCSFAAKGVEADDFMTRFANLGGHLYGKLTMDGVLTGRGSEVKDFVKSMTASGNVSMAEGRLVNLDLINSMAGQFGFKTFQEQNLRDLAGAVKIRDGRLLVEGTKVVSSMGDWDLDGTVAFLDKNLDLRVGVYLTEEYANQINLLGGLLKDDKGRVKIGFSLGGSYDKPTISNISTDKSLIKKKAEDKLKEEADKLLKGLFKKK